LVGGVRLRRGDGFGSGLLLGAGLGLVYAPCAGPILAGVVTVSAAQDFTVGRLAVALAYGIGSAAVLYALMLGGRRLTDRLAPVRGRVQAVVGVVMIAVAIVMAANLDIRFQNAIAADLPGFLVNPTGELEDSGAIATDLARVRGDGGGHGEAGARELAAGEPLPDLGAAPDFADTQQWFNTPGGKALSISQLTSRGKVVLIDFWTYTCINCIRTLPQVEAWSEDYGRSGLVVVGVHSPEFPFERDASNVADAIDRNALTYPVVQDNELGTWNAFHNQYWPAKYLIDANGRIRYAHFGEGDYGETEQAIRSLLAEAGHGSLGGTTDVDPERADPGLRTPETYLGAARARGFVNRVVPSGESDFGQAGPDLISDLPANGFAYEGVWDITAEDATAVRRARLSANFRARRVFLVLGSPGRERTMRVMLDGEPIPDSLAGEDVHGGVVSVGAQRLYRLVELRRAESHVLTLEPQPGISGYAFTFG
jgi:thiol-disulfide isomerase/thioredoxin